jgi:abortive infection bacteriophage resistance protein
LKTEYKNEIAKNFEVNFIDLATWMVFIKRIRNIVAHHEKLYCGDYNVKLKANDKIFSNIFQKQGNEVISNYYNFALITNYLLKEINN